MLHLQGTQFKRCKTQNIVLAFSQYQIHFTSENLILMVEWYTFHQVHLTSAQDLKLSFKEQPRKFIERSRTHEREIIRASPVRLLNWKKSQFSNQFSKIVATAKRLNLKKFNFEQILKKKKKKMWVLKKKKNSKVSIVVVIGYCIRYIILLYYLYYFNVLNVNIKLLL